MALKGMMKGWIVGFKVDNNGTYVRFDCDLKNYDGDKNLVEFKSTKKMLTIEDGNLQIEGNVIYLPFKCESFVKIEDGLKSCLPLFINHYCKITLTLDVTLLSKLSLVDGENKKFNIDVLMDGLIVTNIEFVD